MKNRYKDLIAQTYTFPQAGFAMNDGYLTFQGVSLKGLIDQYGSPLRLTYLPKIGEQINKARSWFQEAINDSGYRGAYRYSYCTKSSYFKFILDEVLEQGVHLETSSAFDIDLIRQLEKVGKVDPKKTVILNNGFKTQEYAEKICALINDGYQKVTPILDNIEEVGIFTKQLREPCTIGIRVATEEEPTFEFYTSRLGIRNSKVISFYKKKIKDNPLFQLRMLHFFVDKGIRDSIYYWSELRKCVKLYCELYKLCPTLSSINIGGGFPIRDSLDFDYDYKYIVTEIIQQIKEACDEEGIPHPNIFTEFGKFTVGESGAVIFSVIGQKQQNDSELWYMINNSLMTVLPDIWGIQERFMLLPINHWDKEYGRVNLGGLTCDNSDYYNSETHINQLYLPRFDKEGEPLHLCFFNTGAYQDALSGFGGIKHCLIPSPKHVLLERDAEGNLSSRLAFPEQGAEEMLRVLGYF